MRKLLALSALAIASVACSDSSSQPKQVCHDEKVCVKRQGGFCRTNCCTQWQTNRVCEDIVY